MYQKIFFTASIIQFIVPLIFIAVFAVFIFVFIRAIKGHAVQKAQSNIDKAFSSFDNFVSNDIPCSLSCCESLYLPAILSDFPDFDVTLAYSYASDALNLKLSGFDGLKIHKITISNYKRAKYNKTIIMQAALEHLINGIKHQKRYVLLYSNTVGKGKNGVRITATCPRCAAPISDLSAEKCEYCDSVFINILGNAWSFTQIYEG